MEGCCVLAVSAVGAGMVFRETTAVRSAMADS